MKFNENSAMSARFHRKSVDFQWNSTKILRCLPDSIENLLIFHEIQRKFSDVCQIPQKICWFPMKLNENSALSARFQTIWVHQKISQTHNEKFFPDTSKKWGGQAHPIPPPHRGRWSFANEISPWWSISYLERRWSATTNHQHHQILFDNHLKSSIRTCHLPPENTCKNIIFSPVIIVNNNTIQSNFRR